MTVLLHSRVKTFADDEGNTRYSIEPDTKQQIDDREANGPSINPVRNPEKRETPVGVFLLTRLRLMTEK